MHGCIIVPKSQEPDVLGTVEVVDSCRIDTAGTSSARGQNYYEGQW